MIIGLSKVGAARNLNLIRAGWVAKISLQSFRLGSCFGDLFLMAEFGASACIS